MKKVKLKIPAKINFTLDVGDMCEGFHTIKTLVASIDLYDEFILKARKDDKAYVEFRGLSAGVSGKASLSAKAAQSFIKKYKTNGADIIIIRHIPAGAGLGGSSADVAGVLNGMAKLYGVTDDLSKLANDLGSDTAYMLSGGFALLTGRGERIERLDVYQEFYPLIITHKDGVSTARCYGEFDRQGVKYPPASEECKELLVEVETERFLQKLKNDLYPPAITLNGGVERNLNALKPFGTPVMTGSGSAVFLPFISKKQRDNAYAQLLPEYGESLIKCKTLYNKK